MSVLQRSSEVFNRRHAVFDRPVWCVAGYEPPDASNLFHHDLQKGPQLKSDRDLAGRHAILRRLQTFDQAGAQVERAAHGDVAAVQVHILALKCGEFAGAHVQIADPRMFREEGSEGWLRAKPFTGWACIARRPSASRQNRSCTSRLRSRCRRGRCPSGNDKSSLDRTARGSDRCRIG
jgi:hypothetical protein